MMNLRRNAHSTSKTSNEFEFMTAACFHARILRIVDNAFSVSSTVITAVKAYSNVNQDGPSPHPDQINLSNV